MNKSQLEQKWKSLVPDGSGYKILRISGDSIPDLFVGIHNAGLRCLILRLPDNHKVNFQSTEKANLSIEYYRETKWIIIKLLDSHFIDLFDDLILSIYTKIFNMSNADHYSSELISMFYKWSEFFNDRSTFYLAEETIKGIFGELLVLREYITETDAHALNDLLTSWKGPYNNRHDFVLLQKDIEVKTREEAAPDVVISSEFQLAPEPGKKLELVVVQMDRDSAGISLHELVLEIKLLVISKLADFTIVLRALSTYGLQLRMLYEYNEYRYKPVAIDTYDCMAVDFPGIIPANISPAITHVSYYLKIFHLNNFLISSKTL